MKVEKYLRGKQSKNYQTFFEAKADSVMNAEYIAVSPDTEIAELIDIFQEKHVNPIPIVDVDKNLLGIVSLSDIVKLISQFREEEIDFLKKSE